ncbi:Tetratricopeptide repeat protein 39B [Halotydeus destructor]|nr:Tetratricopeptide repeat protein 39B [Halotydeus destructor]
MKFAFREEQLHAELIFAECSVFYSVVIVLKDKSVTAVVKAALHGRASHSAFKECNRILQSDRKWSSQESQDAFSSGTTLGLGLYELVMSFLPTRLAKVLQYIGYSGDHQVGLNCLKQCVALSDTCRWPFAVMIFVFYNNFFANIFGTGIKEQPLCEDIVQMFCKKFEASPYATWLTACIHCSRGDVQSASDEFDKIVKLPSDLATKDLPLAETIMLMRAQVAIFQLNWSDAIGWIELFRARSSLSPALACFVQASLLIEQSVDEDDDSLRNQAIELFRAVRTLKKTFGGRMAFHEQFVVERSKQFVKDIPAVIYLCLSCCTYSTTSTTLNHRTQSTSCPNSSKPDQLN